MEYSDPYFDMFKDPEPMTRKELTLHVRQLQFIVTELVEGNQKIRGSICRNASLHVNRLDQWDAREHPFELTVPHYMWVRTINWGQNLIELHPGNRPRK